MCLTPLGVSAQGAQPAMQGSATPVGRFIAEAREGTRRYHSQDAAIVDGFKRVGVEFPAMGEHWVSFERVMEDTLIARRPSVLIYANAGGTPTLAGVAYTALLDRGELPPDFPAARDYWHEHNGSVADESFPIAHHATGKTTGGDEQPLRLSVLHAWIWTPNPAGVFVTDNWRIPFLRLGLPAPRVPNRDAVRALGLGMDEEEYYHLMLRTAANLTSAEEVIAARVLAAFRAQAVAEITSLRRKRRLTAEDSERLVMVWSALWSALERTLPARASQIRELRKRL